MFITLGGLTYSFSTLLMNCDYGRVTLASFWIIFASYFADGLQGQVPSIHWRLDFDRSFEVVDIKTGFGDSYLLGGTYDGNIHLEGEEVAHKTGEEDVFLGVLDSNLEIKEVFTFGGDSKERLLDYATVDGMVCLLIEFWDYTDVGDIRIDSRLRSRNYLLLEIDNDLRILRWEHIYSKGSLTFSNILVRDHSRRIALAIEDTTYMGESIVGVEPGLYLYEPYTNMTEKVADTDASFPLLTLHQVDSEMVLIGEFEGTISIEGEGGTISNGTIYTDGFIWVRSLEDQNDKRIYRVASLFDVKWKRFKVINGCLEALVDFTTFLRVGEDIDLSGFTNQNIHAKVVYKNKQLDMDRSMTIGYSRQHVIDYIPGDECYVGFDEEMGRSWYDDNGVRTYVDGVDYGVVDQLFQHDGMIFISAQIGGGLQSPLQDAVQVENSFYLIQMSGSTTSIDFQKESQHLSVYPNPVTSYFNIDVSMAPYDDVELIDVHGRIIKRFSGREKYDVADVKSGLYIVRIIREGKGDVFCNLVKF